MKKVLLGSLLTLILAAQSAQSAEMKLWNGELETKGFDFVVPVVTDEDQLPHQVGQMFYDLGIGLKIVNPAGGIDRLSTEGSAVVSSSGGGEIIVRARIELSGGTPTVLSQSGSWVDSLTDNGTGDFTINFDSSLFGSAPICVCTVEASNSPRDCQMNQTTTTSAARFYLHDATGAGYDLRANVICMSAQ